MDLTSLAIFRVVALEHSVTRAARRLQRAQSNITTRIQRLEDEIGVPLFMREGKRMTLTEKGQAFLGYAEKMLALADEAHQFLHPEQPTGRLRIGSMESTAASRLPVPLSHFSSRYLEVTLEVSTGTSCSLIESVLAHRLDCALVAHPRALTAAQRSAEPLDEGLEGKVIFNEELLLILPATHRPVAGPEDVVVHTLAGFPQGCTYRDVAEQWLTHNGALRHLPFRVHEVGSYHAILACVAAGSCIGVLPSSVLELQRQPPAVQVVPLCQVDTMLVWRKGYSTAAFERFSEALGPTASCSSG